MLDQQLYVRDKLRELERDDRADALREAVRQESSRRRRRTPVHPLVAGAGRRVRRLGEALEACAR